MPCICHKQVIYCLQLASIPADIFTRVACPRHGPTPDQETKPYIACYLHPDTVVSGSEKLENWPIVYHGTTIEVVRSILCHGQLLMVGDVLCDGMEIGRRGAEEEWEPAIWTNPDRAGADLVAETASYDNGETQFKVLVRLRQKPGTFKVNSKLGYGGYDLWSTNRRGTLYIEALEIRIMKSKGYSEPPLPIPVEHTTWNKTFSCPIQIEAFEVLKLLDIPTSFFNSKHNRCYCAACHPSDFKAMVVAGETYAMPLGWTRFGLAVNPVFAHVNDIWNSWPISFHGCHPLNVMSIIKIRALLKQNDVLPDGKVIPPNFENYKEEGYFLSPEVSYASHIWYATPIKFRTKYGKVKYFQTIFSFKVRSRSFERQEDTEGGSTKLYDNYDIVKKDEMEWYSTRRGCTHPYGLLIRTIDVDNPEALRGFFKLPPEYHPKDDPISFC